MIPTNIISPGLLVRTPTMADLPAVIELITTCDLTYSGVQGLTKEELKASWQSPDFNLATNALLIVSADGNVVAYADYEHREHVRLFSAMNIHPRYRGQGIEQYLLQEIEARARQHIAQAREGARVTLFNYILAGDKELASVLAQERFKHVRSNWRMEKQLLEAPAAPVWPAGITMRALTLGQDERAVFAMIDAAFQDHWGHMPGVYEQWKHWMIEQPSFDPSLWFLAFAGDTLAGGSLCTYNADLKMGWVGQLAVLRPWRRQGLGMALLLQSFGEFYRRGITGVALGVDSQNLTGATRLYTRAGMHAALQFDSYEKVLRPGLELSTQSVQ